jgi:hypothetical protein
VSRVVFTEELIKTFYDKIVLTYPDLPFSTIDKICRAEFKLMKKAMTSGTLEDFRLQYLFNIRVSPARILKQLTYMSKEKKVISPERYKYYLTMMLNHVRKNELKFKRYYDRIEKCTGYTRQEIKEGKYTNE